MYTDKNGKAIQMDDVLFDGENHWRMNYKTDKPFDEEYLLGCQGYQHDLTQEKMSQLVIVGPFSENENLFECD